MLTAGLWLRFGDGSGWRTGAVLVVNGADGRYLVRHVPDTYYTGERAVMLVELYRKDGTTGLMEGSEISTGKWTIEGDKLCTKYKGDDKECYGIKREGDNVIVGNNASRTIARPLVNALNRLIGPDDYVAAWKAFGPMLKQGVATDPGREPNEPMRSARTSPTPDDSR